MESGTELLARLAATHTYEDIDQIMKIIGISAAITPRYEERGDRTGIWMDVVLSYKQASVQWSHLEEDLWNQRGGPVRLWLDNIAALMDYVKHKEKERGQIVNK